jgi:hypothetical protein
MSESNTAVGRALPLWPYSASDNVSRSVGSEPGKIAINLSMSFVDFPWRYAHVPQPEMQLRLYQNMAHGGPPAVAVVGTMHQQIARAPGGETDLPALRGTRISIAGKRNAARVRCWRQAAAHPRFFRCSAGTFISPS